MTKEWRTKHPCRFRRCDATCLEGRRPVALGPTITQPVLRAAQEYRAHKRHRQPDHELRCRDHLGPGRRPVGHAPMSADGAKFRARNVVERGILALLVAAASIAILTTIGIVFVADLQHDRILPASTRPGISSSASTWRPAFRGAVAASDLGVIPLFWGTLYISIDRACWWPCRSDCLPRSIFRNMPTPAGARLRQTDARGAGRYPHHRLRPFRAADGWPACWSACLAMATGRGLDAGRHGGDDRRVSSWASC